MKWMKQAGVLAMVVAGALQLGGCAGSFQARSVDIKQSPLVDPSILVEGKDDQALYRYVNPKTDIRRYDKVMIDPVIIYKDGELDKNQHENLQALANNAYVYLTKELEQDYRVVKSPEPGAMRIQWAIVDADSSKPVRNTISTFSPMGLGLSLVKMGVTGKQMGVGEITLEMKVTDAESGDLLGAALDRRVGGKNITKLWSSWYNADEALKFWAQKVRFVLCDTRGGTACIKPD
jgi:hypothetical protein